MSFQTTRCLKHPTQTVVGVCGSCLKERLIFLTSLEACTIDFVTPALQPSICAGEAGPSSQFPVGQAIEENANAVTKDFENWPKKAWRSKSVCEMRNVPLAIDDQGVSSTDNSLATEGQILTRKVTLRALFDLHDAERSSKKEVGESSCGQGSEPVATNPMIAEDATNCEADQPSSKEEEGRCVSCPVSQGAKHSFWLASLFCRRKARQKPRKRLAGTHATPKGAAVQGTSGCSKLCSSSREQQHDNEEDDNQAQQTTNRMDSLPENELASGCPIRAWSTKQNRQYRSSSWNAARSCSIFNVDHHPKIAHNQHNLKPDYRIWDAYYSPRREKNKQFAAAAANNRPINNISRLDRMRTVKISPATTHQGGLLRFYLTPMRSGSSSRTRYNSGSRPPVRRNPWTFFLVP